MMLDEPNQKIQGYNIHKEASQLHFGLQLHLQ